MKIASVRSPPHNLKYLFEFHPNRGLSIDRRRFEPEYHVEVFYPPGDKRTNVNEYARRVCMVIVRSLQRAGRTDLTIAVTVRHMISEASYRKTFFIDECFDSRVLWPLNEKDTDWHYKFP